MLNFDLDWFDNFNPSAFGGGGSDWDFVFYLPTESAIAWYHNLIPGTASSLQALIPQVQQFAMGEYLNALAKGAIAAAAEYNDVVAKLHHFTGLSEAYIRTSNLRVNYNRFATELLRNNGEMVGRFDGRYVNYNLDIPNQFQNFDPTDSSIDAAYVGSGNYLLRTIMKYNTSLDLPADRPTSAAAGIGSTTVKCRRTRPTISPTRWCSTRTCASSRPTAISISRRRSRARTIRSIT